MEIHAPHGPANTLKEFATHILIVTVGILIALGLEGIRETVHEHHQIQETRELLRKDLRFNHDQLLQQRSALKLSMQQIDTILATADEQNRTPGRLSASVHDIRPGFYFFSASSWDAALSTGVLGHMKPAEVGRFSSETISVRNYVDTQNQAVQSFYEAQAFFSARSTFSPVELAAGRERLQLVRLYALSMNHLLDELSSAIDEAEKTE